LPSFGASYFGIDSDLKNRFHGHPFTLIAVSKTKPYETIRAAYLEGIRVFGENYIPEAIEKFTRLREEFPEARETVRLHHIGPTQSGTIRKLFGIFQYTHGVGSLSTLKELSKRAEKEKVLLRYFLQCNLTNEKTKHGFSIEEILTQKTEILNLENEFCQWEGFMGMGPSDGNEVGTKLAFQTLQGLRSAHFPDKKLSMGMSGDFEWAMEFGADYLRIGSLIFGERSYAR
jgi:pyridoxal phosphate enzyme (YggS family)